jgi:hypothetical protein
MKIRLVYIITATLCGCVSAQQKVSDRTALSAGNLAPATDILPIVDVSAGAAGSKKITIDNLFTGWGTTAAGATLMKAADVAAQQAALSLVPGTHIQAYDADLTSWASKTAPSGTVVGDSDAQTLTNKTLTSPVINVTSDATGDIYYRSAAGAFTRLGIGSAGQFLKVTSGIPAWDTITGGGDLVAANNLSDLASAATARTNLGLGTAAVANLGSASEEIPYWTNTPFIADRVITSVGGAAISRMTFADLATELGVEPLPAYASQAEAEAGTDNVKLMTPLRTAEAIAALGGSGGGTFASQVQAEAGTDTTTYMNPLRTAQAIAALSPADEVTLAGAETLTNKTLTSPVINVTGDATGDIYYRSAGGAFTRLAAGTDGHVLTLASGLPSWAAAGGGGLTNWTEAVNTSAPNATVPAISFTAANAATNVDAILAPKGTGAILARIPDGTTPGGNKRGAYAVDLQRDITVNSQVASGANSVITGGGRNTANSQYAVVSGGYFNEVLATYSMIGGGNDNTVSSTYSVCAGGDRNVVSGTYASVAGGTQNTVSGYAAMSPGGQSVTASGNYSMATGLQSTTRGIHAMIAHSAGRFSTAGDSQAGSYILKRQTTNATETELSADAANPTTGTRIALSNNTTYGFKAMVTARSSGGDTKTWHLQGAIERGANAAATAIVGTVLSTAYEDAGASAWLCTATADTTNGSLAIKGTGAAATNINWTAVIDTVEVSN